MPAMKKLKEELLGQKADIEVRLEKISQEKTREKGPLEADSKEQAVSLQNNEVIDGLDELERKELQQINEALERMDLGTYGTCTECSEQISEKRLVALPFARICVNCSEE